MEVSAHKVCICKFVLTEHFHMFKLEKTESGNSRVPIPVSLHHPQIWINGNLFGVMMLSIIWHHHVTVEQQHTSVNSQQQARLALLILFSKAPYLILVVSKGKIGFRTFLLPR